MSAITIVLADDHHVVRQGLRTLLQTELDCSVVGEASDGLEAVELVERLRPLVLVVDMMMPGLSGLEVTRRVRQRVPQTQVMLLSMHADDAYVREALRSGAVAYVLKEAKAAEFVHAVREAAHGRRYLSAALAQRAIEAYVQQSPETTLDLYETLTARERDVLHLAAEGATNAEIAARLTIGVRTVESYRISMMRKLGLRNQTDLIRYALRRGILPLES